MRFLSFVFLFLILSGQTYSQVLINEFSASNLSGITDEDGERPDWIELYNNSAGDINLGGYFLSDDKSYLSKWMFPSITIKPASHLLVFASGKDRAWPTLSYQAMISQGDTWKYLVPSSDIGSIWKNIGFNDQAWNTGASGFGYGDGDDGTVLNNINSVYIRKEFTITNVQDVVDMILSVDYDDGFVAYLNGTEIARGNLGASGSAVTWDQLTGGNLREATMYQGGDPENFVVPDPASLLVQGTNILSLEGHNANTGSSDLSLIPMLTIGFQGGGYVNNPPAFVQVTGKQLHTSFKISSLGETLILSYPDSSLVDSVAPVALVPDVSYGRKPDGENIWFYFATPTPGSANTSQGFGQQVGDSVMFSLKGGYFPGGTYVQLTTSDPSDTIVYTIDGSEPSKASQVCYGPIGISGNIVLKAKALNSNKLPGNTVTNTYFTKQHKIPVICLSTNPENLWDNDFGIYVLGPNAESANPHFGANFWQDWERQAHMEYYDVDGKKQIDQDIGIKIYGAWSRANAQKSIALYARAEYGKGSFEYQFFKEKPIRKFESLVIRNSGNDWSQSMMRDGLVSTLVSDMDIDRMAFQPAIIYINGEYWGIQNIREKINENFLADNHYIDPDKVNLLETNGNVIMGSNSTYNPIISYVTNNTLESEANYLQASEKIDINNYIQYQLSEIFVSNTDWPGNNIKFWNTTDAGSLWRWIIFDTDFGFSLFGGNSAYNYNTLAFALETNGPGWPNPPWSTLLFRRLNTNPGFRNEFANQFADRLNTNFKEDRVKNVIDSLSQLILPEINDHLLRWGNSFNNWQASVNTMKDFGSNRPVYMRLYLRSFLDVLYNTSVTLNVNSPGSGSIKLNSITPLVYPFTGIYFKSIPVKMTAIPAPGFKFVRWEGTINSNSVSIDFPNDANGNFTAVFEPAGNADLKMVINEINYNSSVARDTKDWVELYNAGITSVNLKNWILSDAGADTGYVFPVDAIVPPGNYIVICRDIAAFKEFNPGVVNAVGDLNFGLSSNGDDVNLFDPDGILMDFVNYAPNVPWPVDANGTGASIELINAMSDNNMGYNWKSNMNGGTPGEMNSNSSPVKVKQETFANDFKLDCFPNPFSDYTSIRIEVPVTGNYKLEVYDLQGRMVNILADQNVDSGTFYMEWDGRDGNNGMLSDGVYIIRLSGQNLTRNLKVIMMK